MNQHRIAELIDRLLSNDLTQKEKEELFAYMRQHREDASVTKAFEELMERETVNGTIDSEQLERGIRSILQADKTHRIPLWNRGWLRYAAAAAIVVVVGAYLLRPANNFVSQQPMATTDKAAPTSMHATLTLANGETIVIDSGSSGLLAVETTVNIERTANGDVVYREAGPADGPMGYNIFSVPRGSRIGSILLADGTRVFLNAGSQLRYPVRFDETERRVELSGEAYFQVAKDAKRRFVVTDGKTNTEVLGTEFNVNAYADETARKTTLVNGSVRVSNMLGTVLLQEGQQSVSWPDEAPQVREEVNLEEVVAWKDGFFYFENASLEAIARQASRWYNVNFVFENKEVKKETFHGKFSRSSSLAELLKVLEYSDVKFEINSNKNEVIIK